MDDFSPFSSPPPCGWAGNRDPLGEAALSLPLPTPRLCAISPLQRLVGTGRLCYRSCCLRAGCQSLENTPKRALTTAAPRKRGIAPCAVFVLRLPPTDTSRRSPLLPLVPVRIVGRQATARGDASRPARSGRRPMYVCARSGHAGRTSEGRGESRVPEWAALPPIGRTGRTIPARDP